MKWPEPIFDKEAGQKIRKNPFESVKKVKSKFQQWKMAVIDNAKN